MKLNAKQRLQLTAATTYEVKPNYGDSGKRNGWQVVDSRGHIVDVYPTKQYALKVKKELEQEAKQYNDHG